MTCVRVSSKDFNSFADLEANTFHQENSVSHLEAELELSYWEIIVGGADHQQTPLKSHTAKRIRVY